MASEGATAPRRASPCETRTDSVPDAGPGAQTTPETTPETGTRRGLRGRRAGAARLTGRRGRGPGSPGDAPVVAEEASIRPAG